MAEVTHELITTSNDLVGYRITKYLGLVRGITVRSRSLAGTVGGMLQTLGGGNITMFTELCEESRQEAYDLMVRHANERGANAVIAVRYESTELMQSVTEVLAYGTAVVVEPSA
ncbi:MAG TPA: heavy metal-binding domain-containing protein [Candidatus Limnocylindria bacterium]